MKKFTPLLLAIFMITACDPSNGLQEILDDAIVFWENKDVQSYIFTYERTCECPFESPIRITVENGIVNTAFYTATNDTITGSDLTTLSTLEDLFDIVQQAIDVEVFRINVAYSKEYGYPELIFIDSDPNIIDEEVNYTATEFEEL